MNLTLGIIILATPSVVLGAREMLSQRASLAPPANRYRIGSLIGVTTFLGYLFLVVKTSGFQLLPLLRPLFYVYVFPAFGFSLIIWPKQAARYIGPRPALGELEHSYLPSLLGWAILSISGGCLLQSWHAISR